MDLDVLRDGDCLTFVEHAEPVALFDPEVMDRVLRFIPALHVGFSSTIRAPSDLGRKYNFVLVDDNKDLSSYTYRRYIVDIWSHHEN
jgi:hypothetical protein